LIKTYWDLKYIVNKFNAYSELVIGWWIYEFLKYTVKNVMKFYEFLSYSLNLIS